jgi:3-phenylpropionate/cinnamic acid dioxygenase small subunit
MVTDAPETDVPVVQIDVDVELQREIEQFLYLEARLLDERQWETWYSLLADDIHYWLPARYNRFVREIDDEFSPPGGMAHFDDDKESMGRRVVRLTTGMAWAENPPSRTRHLVSNVWVRPAEQADEFHVQSAFLVYRNRAGDEVDVWAGRRDDLLRRLSPRRWQIAKRRITLDQSTILSKNLSVFF